MSFKKLFCRWLIAVNREEEAKKLVMKFAESNKKSFSDEEWNSMIITENNKVRKIFVSFPFRETDYIGKELQLCSHCQHCCSQKAN